MKIRQWRVTAAHEFSRLMEYRINFLFRLGVNSVVPLIIKLYLFDAVFRASQRDVISGWSRDQMMQYQFWGALAIVLIEIRTTVENVQMDIRLGRITRYLLYPITMFEIVSAQWLAALVVQLVVFVAGLAVCATWLEGFPVYWDRECFWLALLLVLMGATFWYVIHFTIGLAAFWLEEIWTFFIIFQMVARFLGGNPIPIDMFWDWWQPVSACLPFHWMFYAPVKMFVTGQPVAGAWQGPLILGGWILATLGLHAVVWKAGMRKYAAAGM